MVGKTGGFLVMSTLGRGAAFAGDGWESDRGGDIFVRAVASGVGSVSLLVVIGSGWLVARFKICDIWM